jgi:Ca2+-binding RTX toxin-like protein
MKSLIMVRRSGAVRLAASVLAVAAVVAAATAIWSQPANAARVKLSNGVLTITGTGRRDKIALRLKAAHPGILQIDVGDNGSANFSFRRGRIGRIVVNTRGGADLARIDERNGVFTKTIRTILNGQDGQDSLRGGSGRETLSGGSGIDSLDGNRGNDLALLGAGDDTFVWDPGDGSDTIEGQTGADRLRFNGANVAEQVDLSANGTRFKLFRTQGAITMNTAGVERVNFNALGGADLVGVNDLTGTDVDAVNIELAGTLGGATGDRAADSIVVNATNGVDTIFIDGNADSLKVIGLAAVVQTLRSEFANDRLDINTLAGNDRVDPDGLLIGVIQLFVDGLLVP